MSAYFPSPRSRVRPVWLPLTLSGVVALAASTAPALKAQNPTPPPSPTGAETEAAPQAASVPPQDDSAEAGVEYLTRGPLHEAFATPYEADPEPAMLVQKQPPEAIQEVRPEMKPDGNNVQWIGGYWDYDPEREDFIWISGLWRDVPPGSRWVPGYWTEVDKGYQRISGFWTKDDQQQIAYLPQPPESLEQGPSSQPPSDQHFYIPGCWVYQSGDYAWRPGFWSPQQEQWVWVPARYVWTPRGCIYQAGYWDYEPTYRGTVFTPVYYSQTVYRRPNYRYRPRYVIDTNLALLVHLFVGPQRRHYYYGNYYDPRYRDGYRPWVDFRNPRDRWSYDPLYSYYRGNRRGSQDVVQWVSQRFDYFQANERFRPAANVRAQQDLLTTLSGGDVDPLARQLATVATDLQAAIANTDATRRYSRVDAQQQARIDALLDSQRATAEARLRFESRAAADANVRANLDAATDRVDAALQAAGREALRLPALAPALQSHSAARPRFQAGDDAAREAGNRAAEALDRLPGNLDPRNLDPRRSNPGNLIPQLDNPLPGESTGQRNRGNTLPQLRRPFSDRSNVLPGIPGLPDPQPQRLRSNRSDSPRPDVQRPNLQRQLPRGGNLPGGGNLPRGGDLPRGGNLPGGGSLPGGVQLPDGVKLPGGVKIPGL